MANQPIKTAQGSDRSGALSRGFEQIAVDAHFRDLHRVERGAFAQIVRHHPEGQAVVEGLVLADAAHIGRVIADAFDRRHVATRLALVDHEHARRLAQDASRRFGGNRPLELNIDGLRMTDEHRHAHASRGELDLGSRIFLVSTIIFHSSLVEPSSMKTSIWGMTLKAICLVNFLGSGGLVTKMPLVWSHSSSMASLPAPDTD